MIWDAMWLSQHKYRIGAASEFTVFIKLVVYRIFYEGGVSNTYAWVCKYYY